MTTRIPAWLTVRRVRLASGLVLFTYVTSHLLNHSLGLVSLDAMELGRRWFVLFWRSPPATLALYGALVVHFSLALWAIFQRRTFIRIPPAEAAQLLLGLCIIPLLAQHAIGTRLAHAIVGLDASYAYILAILWSEFPIKGVWQAVATVVAWTHGVIGLYLWLRLKPWFPRWQALLYAGALLLPVLALLGYAETGRDVAKLAADETWYRAMRAAAGTNRFTPETIASFQRAELVVDWLFWGGLLGAIAARAARFAIEKARGLVRITYPDGREVQIAPGLSVLEASQLNGIPHASVCGGRGRCSTCRVRIVQGLDRMPAPSPAEQAVLARISAPPGVRLACQLRPRYDLAVVPLLPPNVGPAAGFQRPAHLHGQEREIAILFADLRGFTQFAERKLPYDVVFVLNRYFNAMGQAVERAGGRVDKFIGDGVMALFGVETDPARACRQALAAAREMSRTLDELNHALAHDLDRPLKIGLGVHVGHVIVGEMGYARATSVTAIGDAVNTASRLEALTKEHGVELVVSEDVAARAKVSLEGFTLQATEIRGRREPLQIRLVARAQLLPGDLELATRA